MSGIFLTNNRLAGIKSEVVSGTPEDLVSADYNIPFTEVDLTIEQSYADDGRKMTGQLTRDAQTPTLAKGSFNAKWQMQMGEYVATGDQATPTYTPKFPIEKAFKMAGYKVVATEPTGLTDSADRGYFTITSTKSSLCKTATTTLLDVESCNDVNAKGVEYKLRGVSTNLTITADTTAEPMIVEFAGQGGVAGVESVDYANIPVFASAESNKTRTIPFKNMDITVTPVNFDGSDNGSTPMSFCLSKLGSDNQATLADVECATSEYGIVSSIITDKQPKLDVSFLLQNLTEFDWWESLSTQKIFKIAITSYEDSAKTLPLFSVEVPRTQMQGNGNVDNNGMRQMDTTFVCLENSQGLTDEDKETDIIFKIYAKTIDQTT